MAGSWKGRWYGGLALVALALLIGLAGLFSLPVVDRDEARFAQASRQMLEAATLPRDRLDPALHAGGVAVPMLGDTPRLNKPPLIYWLQAASVWVFTGGDVTRDAIWMYRVPSVAALIVIVLMTWRIGIEMFGWPTGFLAACMMAVSPVFAWEAHQARADMVLVACTIVTMWGAWGIWARTRAGEAVRSWWRIAAVWIGVGLGVLVKGPITPMVLALTVVMLSLYARQWRWVLRLRPLLGVLIVVGMVLPWVWAVGAHVGWGEYTRIVMDETIGRSTAPKEGHWGPPGYHLVFMVVLFWPGCMLTGLGFAHALRRGLGRRSFADSAGVITRTWRWVAGREIGHAAESFCVAWIVPTWIVFEIVSTKLPHYTMPLYPALALISARAVHWAAADRLPGAWSGWQRVGFGLWGLFPSFVALGALGVGMLGVSVPVGITLMAFGVGSLCWALLLLRRTRARRPLDGMRLGVAYGATLAVVLIGVAIPRATFVWPTRSLEREIQRIDPARTRPVAVAGYREDSIRFMLRGARYAIDAAEGGAWLVSNPDGILVSMSADPVAGAQLAGEVEGFNFGGGDRVRLAIWVLP